MHKKHIQTMFDRAAANYDKHCHLQLQTGNKLIQLLSATNNSFHQIIDLGCGTGFITNKLAAYYPSSHIHATDHSTASLSFAKERLTRTNIKTYSADFNSLSNIDTIFNLAFANMSLQWCHDFEISLALIKNILAKNGVLAFSIPTLGTFKELAPHFSLHSFYDVKDLHKILNKQKYNIITQHHHTFTLYFDNTIAALRSIKNVGANYVYQRQHRGLSGKSLLSKTNITQLTYHISYFIARKE